ncbi:hypothetical protein [Amycolatopsis antarctica]|uniref:hypothetical protein n=1 Tax=Amycolatopsis antarctica TaxID=1854586 RepID=UPI001F0A2F99|nr:hypothetical protein [Amycolatopsis antarctica]
MTDRALLRAVRFADEWQGVGGDPVQFAAHVARLRVLDGRMPRVGTRIAWPADGGPVDRVVARARTLAGAGAQTLAVHFGADRTAERRMAELADALR